MAVPNDETTQATQRGGEPSPPDLPFDQSEQLGRYVVVGVLGRGGMGVVYKAFDPELDRLVALKLVLPGGEHAELARERLLREARALAKLAHPNVVAVHDVGVLGGRVFLALEYVEGQTLRQWQEAARRTPAEVLSVYAQVGEGLAAAHAAGLVHRDVKPDNVIISADGRVRVLDFGLVRADGSGDGQVVEGAGEGVAGASGRQPVGFESAFVTEAPAPEPGRGGGASATGRTADEAAAAAASEGSVRAATPVATERPAGLGGEATPTRSGVDGPGPSADVGTPAAGGRPPAEIAATAESGLGGEAPTTGGRADGVAPQVEALETEVATAEGAPEVGALAPGDEAAGGDDAFGARGAAAGEGAGGGGALGAGGEGAGGGAEATGELTVFGETVGTPRYMAPEQYLGEAVDARSDQFSFCVALYEALYDQSPFGGAGADERLESMLRGERRRAPSRPGVPAAVGRALERGLSDAPGARWPSMRALLDELERARRRAPRRWVPGALAAVMTAVAAWQSLRAGADPRATCAASAARVDEAWGPERRQAVRAAFAASGLRYAAESLRTVESQLDGYAAGWTRMRVEACEATRVRGEQSEELLDLRMQCLDGRLTGLGSLTEALASADAQVVEYAVRALSGLAPLEACADAAALRSALKPPAEGEARRRVQALRDELGRGETLRGVGRIAAGRQVAERVLQGARALGYRPLAAEALASLAQGQLDAGEYDEGAGTLRAAWREAEAARHDEVRLNAWVALSWYESNVAGRPKAALEWADLAGALLSTTPGYARQRRAVEERRMLALARLGRYDEALPVAEAVARRGAEAGAGAPEDASEAYKRMHNASYAFRLAGDVERSLELERRSHAFALARFGADHPETASNRNGLTYSLVLADHCREALENAEETRRFFEQSEARRSVSAFLATQNVGEVLLWLGRPLEAAPMLERALAEVRERRGPEHVDALYPSVLLAKAYAAAGREAEARAALERCRALGRQLRPLAGDDDERYVFAALASELAAAGALDEAQLVVERLEADRAGALRQPSDVDVLLARARLEVARGDARAAQAALEAVRAWHQAAPRAQPVRPVDEAAATWVRALAAALTSPAQGRALAREARRQLDAGDCGDPALGRAVDDWLRHNAR